MNEEILGSFEGVGFEDGQILEFVSRNGDILMKLNSWDEEEILIKFVDVVGFIAYSPIGEDLSHGTANQTDSFIEHACATTGSETGFESFSCFSIWSAWREEPIVRIVAKRFERLL